METTTSRVCICWPQPPRGIHTNYNIFSVRANLVVVVQTFNESSLECIIASDAQNQKNLIICRKVHTNFHAKSGICNSKNGRVIALGTKEDAILYAICYIYTIYYIHSWLYSPNFESLDNSYYIKKFGLRYRINYLF